MSGHLRQNKDHQNIKTCLVSLMYRNEYLHVRYSIHDDVRLYTNTRDSPPAPKILLPAKYPLYITWKVLIIKPFILPESFSSSILNVKGVLVRGKRAIEYSHH